MGYEPTLCIHETVGNNINQMKTIQLLILTALLFGCQNKNQTENGFTVRGEIKNLNDKEILIIKFINGGIELDSVSALNDKFEYAGKVKEPYFVQLMLKDGTTAENKLTEFMLENSEINISGNSTHYDSIKVIGSRSDSILKEYLKKDEILGEKWNNLKLEYNRYIASNDSINKKKTAEELNYILKTERVELLKKYVSDNANSTVGALLPNFCTIEKVLTTEDYSELYNSLSEEIKKTDYAKEIQKKIYK